MIEILVATKEGQGERASDFFCCEEGEPLTFTFECDSDKNNIDGRCGCRRSMSGLKTRKACSTFKVMPVDMTKDQLKKELTDYHLKGFASGDFIEATRWAAEDAKELLKLGKVFKGARVVEKRGDKFQTRTKKA